MPRSESIDYLELLVELVHEFRLPLHLEARRNNYESTLNKFPGPKFLEDQRRLNGLSHAHLVGEDHPRLPLLYDRPNHRNLVRVRLDPRIRQSREGIESLRMAKKEGLQAEPKPIRAARRALRPTGPCKVFAELVNGTEVCWEEVHQADPLLAVRKHDLGKIAMQIGQETHPTIRRLNAVARLHPLGPYETFLEYQSA
jgi:hypothetical protein